MHDEYDGLAMSIKRQEAVASGIYSKAFQVLYSAMVEEESLLDTAVHEN